MEWWLKRNEDKGGRWLCGLSGSEEGGSELEVEQRPIFAPSVLQPYVALRSSSRLCFCLRLKSVANDSAASQPR